MDVGVYSVNQTLRIVVPANPYNQERVSCNVDHLYIAIIAANFSQNHFSN